MKQSKKTLLRNFFIKSFWAAIFAGFAFVGLLFLLTGIGLFGKLPSFKELENPNLAVATEVISSDGEILGKIYRKNRVNVTYDKIPVHLVDAIVATEDARFFNHSGIDIRATIRAIVLLGKRGGGSTITQQLAKNLLEQGRDGRSIGNLPKRIIEKVKEYIVALRLEKSYTKSEIVTMYLNQFDFVYGAVGIQSASGIYFNKDVSELNIEEAAVFAGMLKNPSRYNPRGSSNQERAFYRRNTVLDQMVNYKKYTTTKLDAKTRDSLQEMEIKLDFNPQTHNTGLAPYLRSMIQNDFLKQWIKENPKVDGERYDIYHDGLKIFTTIDSRMQAYAEEAVQEHLVFLQEKFDAEKKRIDPWKNAKAKRVLESTIENSERYKSLKEEHKNWSHEQIIEEMGKPISMPIYHPVKGEVDSLMSPIDSIKYHRLMLQSAFILTEPQTGHIKAWVGGRDFTYFKYDHATSPRQVGSTFKPFVYSVAIENGWSPCFTIPNLPVSIELPTKQIWTPKNSGGSSYDGSPITLKAGLANSMNNISAQLIKDIGPLPVKTMAERAGLKNIPEVHSIALGASEQSVIDMARAYTTFANKGVTTEPIYVSRIEDKNGKVLAEFIPSKVETMSPQTAYIMSQMLRGVVTNGTATRISWKYGLSNFIAGKTGTTNDNTDGWFVGFTPELVGVAWTGCDDPALHFISTAYGQGASAALPIFGLFFKKLYEHAEDFDINKNATFVAPPNLGYNMDCSQQVIDIPTDLPATSQPPIKDNGTADDPDDFD